MERREEVREGRWEGKKEMKKGEGERRGCRGKERKKKEKKLPNEVWEVNFKTHQMLEVLEWKQQHNKES